MGLSNTERLMMNESLTSLDYRVIVETREVVDYDRR